MLKDEFVDLDEEILFSLDSSIRKNKRIIEIDNK